MRLPKQITGQAADFWRDNAPALLSDGRLTEATKSGFVLLCQMHGRYVQALYDAHDDIKVVALSKQVQQLMKAYGMTPESAKRLGSGNKPKTLGDIINEAKNASQTAERDADLDE